MTKFSEISAAFRRLRGVVLAGVVLGPWSLGLVAAPAVPVVGISPAGIADLVLLGRGFDAGLRQGMVCRVMRGATEIAEILVVQIRPACSAALILGVAPRLGIREGDIAQIKILKT